MRKRRFLLAALAVAVFAALPGPLRADPLFFKSSMKARCVATVGDPCSLMEFVLNVQDPQTIRSVTYGDVRVSDLLIKSRDWNLWAFDAIHRVWSDDGDLYNPETGTFDWDVSYHVGDGVNVKALAGGGIDALAPIYLRISMTRFASADLKRFSYAASGSAYIVDGQLVPAGVDYQTGGQVTPEPVTLVLLGSGLAGIAGAARRRKPQQS